MGIREQPYRPHMHPKSKYKSKIEDDNPRQHRFVNVKNGKFDWTRTAMSPSHLLIPFRVLGPTLLSPGDFGHYTLMEILADHRALTTFCRMFFGSLRYARLTAIKSTFGHDILLVYMYPIVKMKIDQGSQTSTPFFLNPFNFFFCDVLFFARFFPADTQYIRK